MTSSNRTKPRRGERFLAFVERVGSAPTTALASGEGFERTTTPEVRRAAEVLVGGLGCNSLPARQASQVRVDRLATKLSRLVALDQVASSSAPRSERRRKHG